MGGGAPRERGRPARMLSRCVPLSFPAMRHPATLPAGTAWARPKQSPGVFAGRSGSRRWARLCQDLCGRDARAPGGTSPHDMATPRGQNCRSIPVPLVVEGGQSVFVSIRVHSWFVFMQRSTVFPPNDPHGRGGGPAKYVHRRHGLPQWRRAKIIARLEPN